MQRNSKAKVTALPMTDFFPLSAKLMMAVGGGGGSPVALTPSPTHRPLIRMWVLV